MTTRDRASLAVELRGSNDVSVVRRSDGAQAMVVIESKCAGGALLRLLAAFLLEASPAFAQQDFVTQFDAYAGYTFLYSSAVSLFENGFAAQFGFRPKTWLSAGIDYSISAGKGKVTPGLLPTALRQILAARLSQLAAAGKVPPGYALVVPIHSRTQTFAFGPQLAFRPFEHETLFLRPLFAGVIYERAMVQPTDQIGAAIAAQLVPSTEKTDTTVFVGVGGGIDILATRHFALRAQADVVWDHLFSDLLRNGRWTVRFSVGPAFNFGKNIRH